MCLANNIRTAEAIDRLTPVKGADGSVGPPPMKAPTVRQISVPTTLSGGEFSAIAGVTDERTKVKELLRHPQNHAAARSILDPAITVHTPEWLWLSTGIRAVDHCVEGICSNEAHAYGDAQALRAWRCWRAGCRASRPTRTTSPHGSIARWARGCPWRPLASGVPMGASHGIGYVLGAEFGVPHGHTSCIMLPAVMRWNKSVNADRQALVAAAMAQPGDDAGDVLDAFIGGLGMPRSLGAVKIGREHFPRIAEQAMGTPWVPRNPRPIHGPAEVREILELAA